MIKRLAKEMSFRVGMLKCSGWMSEGKGTEEAPGGLRNIQNFSGGYSDNDTGIQL